MCNHFANAYFHDKNGLISYPDHHDCVYIYCHESVLRIHTHRMQVMGLQRCCMCMWLSVTYG